MKLVFKLHHYEKKLHIKNELFCIVRKGDYFLIGENTRVITAYGCRWKGGQFLYRWRK